MLNSNTHSDPVVSWGLSGLMVLALLLGGGTVQGLAGDALIQALGATLGLIDLTGSDVTSGVALAPGGTLVVAGTTKSAMDQPGGGSNDVFTLRLSRADGTVQQVRQLGAGELHFGTAGSDSALDACSFPDGSIGVVGTTTGSFAETSGGASDAFALRLRPEGGL